MSRTVLSHDGAQPTPVCLCPSCQRARVDRAGEGHLVTNDAPASEQATTFRTWFARAESPYGSRADKSASYEWSQYAWQEAWHVRGDTDAARIAALEARVAGLQGTVEDMAWQFGYRGTHRKRRVLTTGGLSALESAFGVLGWKDPHVVTDGGCEWPGCTAWADCGIPTARGYLHVCGPHYGDAHRAALREGA